jgi:hypothetical protein
MRGLSRIEVFWRRFGAGQSDTSGVAGKASEKGRILRRRFSEQQSDFRLTGRLTGFDDLRQSFGYNDPH